MVSLTWAKLSKNITTHIPANHPSNATSRWINLKNEKDPKKLWKSIAWSGSLDNPDSNNSETPSNTEFIDYYSHLLSCADPNEELVAPDYPISIPILEELSSPQEINNIASSLKNSKAGHDGVPPAILKCLPFTWFVFLSFLINIIFISYYPIQWCYSVIFNI